MKALFVLLLLVPFQTHPLLSKNFLPGITPIKIFGLLTLFLGVMYFLKRKEKSKGVDSIAISCLMFCLGQLLLGSILHESLGANAVRSLVSFTLFFFCVTLLVDSLEKLKLVFIACVIGMAWSSLYMFKEYISFRHVYNGFRPRGSFGDSNYYSIASLVVIPMGIVLIKQYAGWKRIMFAAMTVSIVGGLLVGQSRGGLIGFCLLGMIYWINSQAKFKSLIRIIALGLIVALMLPDNFWIRIQKMSVQKTTEVSGDDLSNKRRVELPAAGYTMFLENPITGVGPGNYKKESIKYNPILRDIGGPGIAHNTYIEILAEMGLSGILLFAYIVFGSIHRLNRIMTLHREDVFLFQSALALKCGFYCFLFSAIFLSAQFSKFFWLSVFITIVFHKISTRHRLAIIKGENK